MLDDPSELVGPYFWSRDVSWSTTDPAQLDAAEKYVVDNLAPHLASFDSKPGSGAIPTAQNALIQAYNGDARLGITTSKDPSRWQWVLPGPRTELWMDNWAIVAGAEHPEAAHAFINTMLDPKNALKELSYIGYNTGTVGIEDEARKLNLPRLDMIFYNPSQVATMETLKLTDAQQRLVDIWSKVKAAAGG
jgi:spermidine/putrescine transport system substrate-binding protein